jgi:hypothetical protein
VPEIFDRLGIAEQHAALGGVARPSAQGQAIRH